MMMFSVGSRLASGGWRTIAAARQALADIVVGVARQLERDAVRQEGAEALPGSAVEARTRSCPRAGRHGHSAWRPRPTASRRRYGGRCGSAARSRTGSRCSSAGCAGWRSARCRAPCRGRGPASRMFRSRPPASPAPVESCDEVDALGLPVSIGRRMSSRSTRPTISSKLAEAQLRHQLAHFLGDEEEVVDHVLGLAGECLRSTGSCVATPTGQVLRWHLRIMMQPAAINGAVAKPNSSAPSSAPTTTSRPVLRPPSTCTAMRPRRPFQHQGLLRLGEADLPGRAGMVQRRQRAGAGAALKAGDRDMIGARLADTPAATVPTPTSDTSFTDTARSGWRSSGRG